ncbi:nuclear transport factor 2-like [Antechinus flavipes]|uniref:nuclear transport factor 2-like n=1 Tax=Antechinus flavipes TaxID=38775 RepID=UPI002236A98A|nr:nuclear transport factor 2-like [Antechinus flavipes]
MAESPMWEQVGASFVHLYYRHFDADRVQLSALYTEASCLSWEGEQFQGKSAIMEKMLNLPFQKIQHSITSQDHQPAPDNCILSMVVGQLKGRYQTDEFRMPKELLLEFKRDHKNIGVPDQCREVSQKNLQVWTHLYVKG